MTKNALYFLSSRKLVHQIQYHISVQKIHLLSSFIPGIGICNFLTRFSPSKAANSIISLWRKIPVVQKPKTTMFLPPVNPRFSNRASVSEGFTAVEMSSSFYYPPLYNLLISSSAVVSFKKNRNVRNFAAVQICFFLLKLFSYYTNDKRKYFVSEMCLLAKIKTKSQFWVTISAYQYRDTRVLTYLCNSFCQ